MGFPGAAAVDSKAVYTFQGKNAGKRIKVTVSNLQESVVIYVTKSIPGSRKPIMKVLEEAGSVEFDDDNGTVQILAALKQFPLLTPGGTRAIAFGQNVSFDNSEPNNAGAEIFWKYNDKAEANRSISAIRTPTTIVDFEELPWADIVGEIGGTSHNYVTYGALIANNGNGLVEGQVSIHFWDPGADINNGGLMGVIRDTSKEANDQGAPFGNIENNTFDVSTSAYPDGLYFVGLIQYKVVDGKLRFEIGDPKDDADIQIDEV